MSLRPVEAFEALLVSVTRDFPEPNGAQNLYIVGNVAYILHDYTEATEWIAEASSAPQHPHKCSSTQILSVHKVLDLVKPLGQRKPMT